MPKIGTPDCHNATFISQQQRIGTAAGAAGRFMAAGGDYVTGALGGARRPAMFAGGVLRFSSGGFAGADMIALVRRERVMIRLG